MSSSRNGVDGKAGCIVLWVWEMKEATKQGLWSEVEEARPALNI